MSNFPAIMSTAFDCGSSSGVDFLDVERTFGLRDTTRTYAPSPRSAAKEGGAYFIVTTEESSYLSIAEPVWRILNSQLLRTASVSIDSIKSQYDSSGWDDVHSYLNKNADLIAFLTNIPAHIKTYSEVNSLHLSYYLDIEEGWEKLFLVLRHNIDDVDQLVNLQSLIYNKVFKPYTDLHGCRIVLSLE